MMKRIFILKKAIVPAAAFVHELEPHRNADAQTQVVGSEGKIRQPDGDSFRSGDGGLGTGRHRGDVGCQGQDQCCRHVAHDAVGSPHEMVAATVRVSMLSQNSRMMK